MLADTIQENNLTHTK